MKTGGEARPAGVTALNLFFCFGAAASFVAVVSLLFPGSFLKHAWRLNPRAQAGFAGMGAWAFAILVPVCAACLATAVGLWRGARWGYGLAVSMLALNFAGDAANVLLGTEPRAVFGLPVVVLLLTYLLTKRVRRFFFGPAGAAPPKP